jgi:hypothetical protein
MHDTPFNLRRWLSKHPHPDRVKAEFEDGQEKVVRIGVNRSKFRDAEEALRGAVWLQAVDPDGVVLREWSDVAFEQAATEKKDVLATTGDNSAMLSNFAALLASAYENGAKAHAEAYKMAFELMALLCNTIIGRNAALEKVLLESIQNPPEQAEGDPNAGLVAAILPALAASLTNTGARPPPSANGAA